MRLASIAVALSACCPPPAEKSPTTPAPVPVPVPVATALPTPPVAPADPVRLATGLEVTSARVQLSVDPDQPTFTGRITIHARLPVARRDILLHGEKLTIASATANGTVPLVATDAGKGRLRFTAERDVPAGDVVLDISYTGQVDDTDTMGVFREQDHGHWYAFTQFEALAARRAFPCIDEPAVKVPWTLVLDVPAGQTAVANMPVASDTTTGGRRTFEFQPTPPLPSYLVAFGVGPFEIVDAGKSPAGKPIRIIALAGRAAEARVAAEETPKIVGWLEHWFDMPYPYPKIDALAIPITVSFGAMENVGLITYRSDIMLMPDSAPEGRKRRYARYAAHEMSHQWFGDLVTPAWWDDIWLNESFASWLPYQLMSEVFPSWSTPEDRADGRGGALDADSLGTARRIRQPIETEDDIVSAFDGITYGKGAAVLHMFEAWAGQAEFQRGVRQYLRDHANGNATAADFVAAVSAATGKDITTTMSTFLDQAGAPRLEAHLTCDGDRARISISQSRYLPIGAEHSAAAPVWKLPVCVVYGAPGKKAGAAGARHQVCGLITQEIATLEGDGCVDGAWLYPNVGGNGYYRSALGDGVAALIKDGWRHLDGGERLAAAQDIQAEVAAGEADISAAFGVIPLLLAEGNRPAVALAAEIVDGVRRFLPPGDPAIARWIKKQFGPTANRLGWRPKKTEPVDASEIRTAVVPLVAELGGDRHLIDQATVLAKDWRKLPEDIRGSVMLVAARAHPALTEPWRADFIKETDRIIHRDLAGAIGRIPDRAQLEQALALLLDPKVDVREAALILAAAAGDPITQAWTEAWTVDHLDALIARYPEEGAARLVGALTHSCDPDRVAPMRAVADAKIAPLSGGPRAVEQAFEGLAQCIAQRHALEPALEAWRKTLK